MIFSYWNHDTDHVPPSHDDWKGAYPKFHYFTAEDVSNIIEDSELKFLFNRTRLEAAKSDIARLVLLYEFGGLYMDAHAGTESFTDLVETLDYLSKYDTVFFGKKWELSSESDFNLMNTVIASRAKSQVISHVLAVAKTKMKKLFDLEEQKKEYVPYELHDITGTQNIMDSIFDCRQKPPVLRPQFRENVSIRYMDNMNSCGFFIYKHYKYRSELQHWSDRQKTENLFIHE